LSALSLQSAAEEGVLGWVARPVAWAACEWIRCQSALLTDAGFPAQDSVGLGSQSGLRLPNSGLRGKKLPGARTPTPRPSKGPCDSNTICGGCCVLFELSAGLWWCRSRVTQDCSFLDAPSQSCYDQKSQRLRTHIPLALAQNRGCAKRLGRVRARLVGGYLAAACWSGMGIFLPEPAVAE
jgi:hypothetical protein